MPDNVTIVYSKYGNVQLIDSAEFTLADDMVLNLQYDLDNKEIGVMLSDTGGGTELSGIISDEKLTTLIRILNQFKSQILRSTNLPH